MSDSSDGADDRRRAESTGRMRAEPQPGPSRCQRSRQGYCGYCRVLYNNLDQHLFSLGHLDSVRMSSRGPSRSRTRLTLLERFLQDVLQHHPHRYGDPRPSHADLPSVSAPLLPRTELDTICFFDDDSRSLGTREHLPSSDGTSCPPANQEGEGIYSQSGDRVPERDVQERLSASIRQQEDIGTSPTHSVCLQAPQTPPPHTQGPPSVHRKAHRKTNRRKTSESSSSSTPPRDPNLRPHHQDLNLDQGAGTRPWLSWQKERREALKEEAFSSDHSDSVDRTIDQVIQMCCYSIIPCEHEETESFHFSLPVTMETQSDDWDSPVRQMVLQRAQTVSDTQPSHTPVQLRQAEGRSLDQLMDVQVDLEDHMYSHQLDSALHCGHKADEQGFWTLPIEEVLPAPAHIPESFRGKTWAQIEQEDEKKVEKLVRQFRRGRFVCYFDSESLARYGRRSQKKRGRGDNKEGDPNMGVLPLLDRDDDESVCGKGRKRRSFRLASRCQVVKVSHSTQTVQLVIPAVRQGALQAPPPSVPAASQNPAERTPEAQTWRCLPRSYTSIVTPVQPRTSLVYLLCSPSGPASSSSPAPGSAPKRSRKKRRPLDLQGIKVKYKRLPVRFYDPNTNRILKNAPKGFLWGGGPTPSGLPLPCVRQLFRSLSPDLNSDRPPVEGPAGSSRVKGHTSSDPPFSHASSLLLSTFSRDSKETDKREAVRRKGRMSNPPTHNSSERGMGGGEDRTRAPTSKRTTRAQATPLQPRREGLRRTRLRTVPSLLTPPPPTLASPRRGRGRRRRR
ncbi:DBF4-type zinc finger-containing protein 2 isoform X2 [Echeneis naucrates]|uniref:DBF4-type zinc finger-containing protein 2 isoform X2 n=1 Tax=Echeneis naucrates TaxID=173247 RepID=UPI0011141261|nr:DBF4-type zinc finger-containing protein 2 isoform X2 [Echeneis naucrates]XP_029369918.1 DBF4-type zinc finger-containing protein 2 isoform X2 [Echeneis naucrates]